MLSTGGNGSQGPGRAAYLPDELAVQAQQGGSQLDDSLGPWGEELRCTGMRSGEQGMDRVAGGSDDGEWHGERDESDNFKLLSASSHRSVTKSVVLPHLLWGRTCTKTL